MNGDEAIPADGLRVILTGTGSALADPLRGGASVAVAVDGTVIQIDIGRMALENLLRAGIAPTRIDTLLLTHHHFDHIASLGYFLMSNWIAGRQAPVEILGPARTVDTVAGVAALHAGDMAFGADVHRNWPEGLPGRIAPAPPHTARDVAGGAVIETQRFTLRAMSTVHYTYPGATGQSLAWRIETRHGTVVVSGDTGPMEEMVAFARGADLLIHEAQRPDPGMTSGGKMARPDFGRTLSGLPRNGGGHTSPGEVGIIAAAAGVRCVVSTHLPPWTSVPAAVEMAAPYTGRPAGPDIWADYRAAIAAHFSGEIVIAADGMCFEWPRR